MRVLLTGGAGYIGSHIAAVLLEKGYDVAVADNYCNSSPVALDKVEEITGKRIARYCVDAADLSQLRSVFEQEQIDAVIHLSGLKAVGESVSKPLEYYNNNLGSTIALLACMREYGVHALVFSSSATVYGAENPIPYIETMPRGSCTNPYGWTKSMNEQIIEDACRADGELKAVILRYFNPIGAHPSGKIGEDARGIPNNIMPYITKVAVGELDHLTVFGGDYDTKDGTCERDFIHVMDLAEGHVRAIDHFAVGKTWPAVFNLGTGTPYSVLELVHAFEQATGRRVPYVMGDRREGDLPAVYADAGKAERELGWTATRSLQDMCKDAWRWQSQNPSGYEE